jgi:signal transduction histidine kinase
VIVGRVSSFRDVSERVRLERELRQAQHLETVGRIAAQVVHDYNNLLAPILGYAEIIKDRLPAGHALTPYCEFIVQAAEHLAQINDDLVALGRRGHVERVPCELGAVVSQALASFTVPLDVPLTVELRDAPLIIRGNEGQILRVVASLLLNARAAVEQRGGAIAVHLDYLGLAEPVGSHTLVPPGTYARLSVADSGPGIRPAVAERMFEAFFTTQEHARRGAGLGLTIVQSVLLDHGGYLDYTTSPTEGTTFTAYLPCVDAPLSKRL